MSDIQDEILKAINIGITKRLNNANFDRTYVGIVDALLSNNVYQIKYDGGVRKVKVNNASFSIGDIVHVTLPQNSSQSAYIVEDGKGYGDGETVTITGVTGVKGSSETAYRTGAVSISPVNIGLGKVDNTADSEKSVNYATSSGNANTVNNHTVAADVPADAKFTDTDTWIAFKGSGTTHDGTSGYVPAPTSGDNTRFLRCDGKWVEPEDNDTHWTTHLRVGSSDTSKINEVATNGNVYLNITDSSTIRDSHKIIGGGRIEVKSNSSGDITITDENSPIAVYSATEPTTKKDRLLWIYKDA